MGTDEKKKVKVFILTESYNDGDQEIFGVFDSMKAACIRFAERIACECLVERYPGVHQEIPKEIEEAVKDSARAVARLLPTLLGVDVGDDECRDGKAVYGLMEETLEGIDDEGGKA